MAYKICIFSSQSVCYFFFLTVMSDAANALKWISASGGDGTSIVLVHVLLFEKKKILIERLLICWTSYSAPWLQWAPTRDINGLMEFEFLRQRVWHRLCHIVVHSRTVTTTSSFAICRQHYAVEIKHTLLTPVYFAITQLACAQILWSVWNSHFNCWLRDETTFASTRHCSAF